LYLILSTIGLTQAGGLEGTGVLWVSLLEASFSPVVSNEVAHYGRKRRCVAKVAPSPPPLRTS